MAKAEPGTAKYIANKIKAKGLQKLRWYCQVCEKQCRDENGFKCHTQSEAHVRRILNLKGSDKATEAIENFSRQFKADFLYLLRTSHGEKPIGANKFYAEYIQNKSHVHMNATRWRSLSAFVRYLERQKICKVTEDETGLVIAYIDASPQQVLRNQLMDERRQQDPESDRVRSLERQIKRAEEQKQESDAPALPPPQKSIDEPAPVKIKKKSTKQRLTL